MRREHPHSSEPGPDREPVADPEAVLGALLRAGTESVEVPADLWDRIRDGRPAPTPRPRSRNRSWLSPLVASVATLAVAAAVLLGTGMLRPHRWELPPLAPGAKGVSLTVYNAEAACQSLHTIECSLSVVDNPHAAYAERNTVGRVWHGERVTSDCVITDGTVVIDEAGVSSARWYHVTLPDGGTGWLPGVRTRNSTEVPLCATDPASP
ncbi:hypothetical protein P3T37_002722 [Kitasatospora sp. MAA4]|uniref:hypothetical protein n=1 Tax=Kitasatospora sp. MAA4 TaxID=3035093 RepID=UPI00247448DB|nr:hypothetical protein [Kitasatospora sp. MAA4]MDH6133327.1 hypothetical protein [Kitasatospora sp. MAA4]